jgi:hypothetical protein
MEGSRISSVVALYRDVSKPVVLDDNGKKLDLKPGQRVLCNLVSRDFATPTVV